MMNFIYEPTKLRDKQFLNKRFSFINLKTKNKKKFIFRKFIHIDVYIYTFLCMYYSIYEFFFYFLYIPPNSN
uniref:Uncharacterized protein n=1 Tax=Glossina palpalis gambiensis TaxID=67801 RepID=A0A1B0BZK8_9MUSC